MSMRPVGLPEIPEQTVVVARAAFPKGSLAIRARDRLAEVFVDEPFTEAFGVRGAPGLSPGVLSLVMVLQFTEGLTDRQAAAMAVRAIDASISVGRSGRPGSDRRILARLIKQAKSATIRRQECLPPHRNPAGVTRRGTEGRASGTARGTGTALHARHRGRSAVERWGCSGRGARS